jgi:predicted RNA methylase
VVVDAGAGVAGAGVAGAAGAAGVVASEPDGVSFDVLELSELEAVVLAFELRLSFL